MSNSASSQKLKIGDVVKLKSGGPTMTVIRVEDEDVYCMWFIGEYQDMKVDSYRFPSGSLQLIVE